MGAGKGFFYWIKSNLKHPQGDKVYFWEQEIKFGVMGIKTVELEMKYEDLKRKMYTERPSRVENKIPSASVKILAGCTLMWLQSGMNKKLE